MASGTFAINTDHASVLNRQPDDWMVWDPISISLSWLGFHDIHTQIDHYLINIGSHYLGNDLNMVTRFVFMFCFLPMQLHAAPYRKTILGDFLCLLLSFCIDNVLNLVLYVGNVSHYLSS